MKGRVVCRTLADSFTSEFLSDSLLGISPTDRRLGLPVSRAHLFGIGNGNAVLRIDVEDHEQPNPEGSSRCRMPDPAFSGEDIHGQPDLP